MSLIDRPEIAQKVRSALDKAGPDPWLVGYDVAGVQDLITSNGRPLGLRGASELLKDFDIEQGKRASEDGFAIFAGGGRGTLVCAGQQRAEDLVKELKQEFVKRVAVGTLATAVVPLRADQGASLRHLGRALDRDRDGALAPEGHLPVGREDTCTDCGIWKGTYPQESDGERRLLCDRCQAFMEKGWADSRSKDQKELSTNDLGERGYVAVISGDGNAMGALFASLDSLEQLAGVSEAVHRIFTRAHRDTCEELFPERRTYLDPVLGGDDLRVLVPPSKAFAYCQQVASHIEKVSMSEGDLDGLLNADQAKKFGAIGVGFGILVVPSQYPIRQVMGAAHELEVSAKKGCRRNQWRSGLDYTFLTTPDFDVVEARRQGHTDPRPLNIAALSTHLKQAQALEALPTGQLSILRQGVDLEEAEFFNLHRYQVARSSQWQAYFDTCGADWRNPRDVETFAPTTALVEMMRILGLGRVAGRREET